MILSKKELRLLKFMIIEKEAKNLKEIEIYQNTSFLSNTGEFDVVLKWIEEKKNELDILKDLEKKVYKK